QPFDLVEHGLVRGVYRLMAIDFTRDDDTHRWPHLLHGANLHGRSLRAQQNLARYDPEGVLHIAGGVVRRYIEGLEVVVIGFYFRPLYDMEAHLGENLGYFPDGARDG